MNEAVVIESYNEDWPAMFAELGFMMRSALGGTAVRIDHIGSTSVPGLDAKPILDVQISVSSFEPFGSIREPLEAIGFLYRADNPDLTKRYFRERPGQPRIHIHVRREGSWSQQFALLFRDYLRVHPDAREQYAELKRRLAKRYGADRQGYVDAKGPFIWTVMQQASDWSQAVGWTPGASDA